MGPFTSVNFEALYKYFKVDQNSFRYLDFDGSLSITTLHHLILQSRYQIKFSIIQVGQHVIILMIQ